MKTAMQEFVCAIKLEADMALKYSNDTTKRNLLYFICEKLSPLYLAKERQQIEDAAIAMLEDAIGNEDYQLEGHREKAARYYTTTYGE